MPSTGERPSLSSGMVVESPVWFRKKESEGTTIVERWPISRPSGNGQTGHARGGSRVDKRRSRIVAAIVPDASVMAELAAAENLRLST
jgi:hypothetical protein